jgi:hypothetical protein
LFGCVSFLASDPGKIYPIGPSQEKIIWTDHVRNEVLLTVKEQRNILHEISKRKANWIGHILCRNCLLGQIMKGKIKQG